MLQFLFPYAWELRTFSNRCSGLLKAYKFVLVKLLICLTRTCSRLWDIKEELREIILQ